MCAERRAKDAGDATRSEVDDRAKEDDATRTARKDLCAALS